MNILFDGRVLKHLKFSGVENYTSNIIEALKAKINVTLLQPDSENKYLQQLWEHTKLPFSAKESELLFCPANIAPLWLSRKTRLVITLHDVAFRTFPGSFSKAFSKYYTFIVPINIRRAEQIITVSEASKQEIIRFYPAAAEKLTVIALGINEKYKVLPEIQKKKQILYVGAINERKNMTGVIRAFEMLSKDVSCTLVIVGNLFSNFSLSKEMNSVLERAVSNKDIIFKEGLDDEMLIREYNSASCFVFPSFYEGFGLPPLEAMACGTPVVTSGLSSMPEVCGDAALYVDPYDIEQMAQTMRNVIEDDILQKKLIVKGLEHVKTFTWEKAAKDHVEVFKKVLSQ